MKNRIRFTDAVLVLLGVGTVLFIIRTFEVFVIVGSEPSALVAGVFSFVTAEAAILWRIYEGKHKRKEEKKTEDSQPDEWELDIDADPNEACEEIATGGSG